MGCLGSKEAAPKSGGGGSGSAKPAAKKAAPAAKEYTFKLLMVGEAGVGKSSLLLSFINGEFPESTASTVEVDFLERKIETSEGPITLQTYDTAGQEKFRQMTSSYYRQAEGVLICFDLSRKDTFEKLDKWIEQVSRYGPVGCTRLFVGLKSDLESTVTEEEAEALAKKNEGEYMQCSAKADKNVKEVFESIAVQIRNQKEIDES
eukprot:TRINITY_DN6431_c0_g1_i1.p1 TRINITY_DN6431_c0_g1~~TRINITY_DN6431_c0_g1_i1.p1  ORF type:complete len:205 (+),score=47.41 TRINITY_DN6431_c0_g1_i1:34-648(+)